MTSALQNRLVGTIIVVAIAVIFLPDLLDGKKQATENTFIDLPSKPLAYEVEHPGNTDTDKIKEVATRKIEVVSEKALDDADDRGNQDQVANLNESASLSETQEKEVIAENVKSSEVEVLKTAQKSSLEKDTVIEEPDKSTEVSAGWVVQLGSFRHKKNVTELLNILEEAGYRAFSRPVKTNSGVLTKVFVGPDLRKSNLEEALSHLKELTKLQGRVTPFTVQ
ncbi:SPOR domain-containing protein [Paraglaciecola sp. 2405UD69-4]|uniref:SPOR domain-containing protein n=1 Tax=Paraglaciecola sp. 2405UD69-4 TaxID=3391836 RepID=UPI0039C96A83